MTLLLLLSILSPLVPLVIGFRKRNSLLWIYPFVAFFFDLLGSFLKRGLEVSNSWASDLFMLSEFVLLSLLYKDKIFRNRTVLFYTLLIGTSLFFIIHTMLRSPAIFNMLGCCPFLLLYLCYGITGFYSLLKRQENLHIEKSWFFWLNVALLVYAAGAFPFFLFKTHLVQIDRDRYMTLWYNVFLLVNISRYLLLAVALHHFRKPPKHGQPV